MLHMMVDCETLALERPALLSVGATVWSADGDGIPLLATRYWCVDLLSCVLAGLTISPDTVHWWRSETTPEARAALYSAPRQPLEEVLRELADFWTESRAERLWSNGPAADAAWLEAAYRATGIRAPWSHRDVRCYRTLLELARVPDGDRTTPAVPHDARSDAIAQAIDAERALREIIRMQRNWDERPFEGLTTGLVTQPAPRLASDVPPGPPEILI